jgi:multidrug efflux pump subunit AcrA (membrane-fusion protein)
MFLTRIKLAALAAVGLGVLALTVGLVYQTQAGELARARAGAADLPPLPAVPDPNRLEVPALRDGRLLVVGTEIKEGEKVPADQMIQVKQGDAVRRYRRLRVGDPVAEGQLLARLDDRLARGDLEIAEAKIEAAQAEMRAAQSTWEEAKERLAHARKLGENKVISAEEIRGAALTAARYEQEVNAKKAEAKIAQLQAKAARALVEMYEVRSPVNGVIKVIYKKRGEAVRSLEPVLQIEIKEDGKDGPG